MSKYFIDTEIYLHGKRTPPQKILITVNENRGDKISCYDENGNFYLLSPEEIYDDEDNPIKDARNKIHMTQTEFSKFLNIPKRTLEDWESKKSNPPKYTLNLIIEKVFAIIDLKEGE